MKLYMVRKTLDNGVKEYASAGMSFSSKSSRGWGRIGNLKSAIRNKIYNFRHWDTEKEEVFNKCLEWELRDGGKITVLEIDIDDVTIVETDIKDWYLTNMVKEK